ncbi:MAG: enoyl-CoA hydratase-related protein [Albimonas sp.]|uniref:enoyl-CoA hydratase-related protein n=1 Tax=Albimonas sp. TaxID=1872425 RepID=UPI0040579DA8|tara:strand:+ start:255 stop:1142 length:888 start_codon:yes stop_codon:yes gene_type:complete
MQDAPAAWSDIAVARHGDVCVITLNRPDKLNAYTGVMGVELARALHEAAADDAVRAVVVTGAGRAFCAGADVSAGADAFDTGGESKGQMFGDMAGTGRRKVGGGFVEAIFDSPKPVIAAINGPAVGVGLTLTLPMDVRIVAEGAKLGFIFARRGLVPEAGSAWFLPRIVGLPQALRWSMSGRVFGPEEALAGGLVSEVVAPEALLERALEIAAELTADSAPVSVALTRQLLWRFAGAPDPWGLLEIDAPMSLERGRHPDVKEGVASFLEKRKAAFPGKVSSDMPSQYPWWPQPED